MKEDFTDQIYNFLKLASAHAYAGGEKGEDTPDGFRLHKYEEGDWNYTDKYAGYTRSSGSETIFYKGKAVFATLYRGGMTDGNEQIADETFNFLKKALSIDYGDIITFRGPDEFEGGRYSYKYLQEGDIKEFKGHEKIYKNGELVFYHEMIGGIIIS